jgi:hypothetical protein
MVVIELCLENRFFQTVYFTDVIIILIAFTDRGPGTADPCTATREEHVILNITSQSIIMLKIKTDTCIDLILVPGRLLHKTNTCALEADDKQGVVKVTKDMTTDSIVLPSKRLVLCKKKMCQKGKPRYMHPLAYQLPRFSKVIPICSVISFNVGIACHQSQSQDSGMTGHIRDIVFHRFFEDIGIESGQFGQAFPSHLSWLVSV